MTYWPFWTAGLALAGVALAHWLLLGRLLAVSGRYTAIVDRLRGQKPVVSELSTAELLEALQATTAEAFGEQAVGPVEAVAEVAMPLPRQGLGAHVSFLVAVAVGGALSAWLGGGWPGGGRAVDPTFVRLFGGGTATAACVLLGGGTLVGFGTRMAGGCTSGHGLCGVSRFQPGSLVATAAFFGAGIATSLALELVMRPR